MAVRFEPFELIPFKKEHSQALITLIANCYAEYGQKIELETLDRDLLCIDESYPSPESAFRILMHEEKLIGSVAVKGTGKGEAELKRVFLDPVYRGQGLGKKLSRWAHEWARNRGCRILHVWSDVLYETAHHLYRKLGARDTGKRRELGGVNNVAEYYFAWPIDRDQRD